MNHKYFDCNGDCAEADNLYPMNVCDKDGPVGHFILRYIDGRHAVDYAFRIVGAELATIGVSTTSRSRMPAKSVWKKPKRY